MELAVFVLSIIASFLAVCAFVASTITGILVVGWSKSTHKIIQVPTDPVKFEYDLPPEEVARAKLAVESKQFATEEEYTQDFVRRAREAALEDALDD